MSVTISAVVVTNRPALLERYALPGLSAVRRAGMEALVLDQSDSGGAEELARAEDLRWLRSTPPLARGRNEAVAVTSSEVIAFVDDDAEFDAGWAGTIAELFADRPEVGVVAGRATDARGRRWPGATAGLYGWPTNPFGLCNGFNLAFRRAALADAGSFDEALGAGAPFRSAEDTDMVYRVMRCGWQVLCSDDVTVVHHDWRSGSQQLRLHYGYGYGAGAQTAGHAAQGDHEALRVARSEALKHVLTFVRAALTLRLRVAAVQPPFLIGMWAGYRARQRVLSSNRQPKA
jgi:GT2 family glycosyltransferase